jgi:UDP-glucuronate decarboxylase
MALMFVLREFSIPTVSRTFHASVVDLTELFPGPRSTSPDQKMSSPLTLTKLNHLLVNPFDGRVVSNFIVQALRGEDMTVYGDGKQTRSFQYIHDLIDGMIALMNSDETRPVNLGNPDEFTIGEFAELVREIVEKVQKEDGLKPRRVNIVYKPMPTDDPQKRRPDITRAKQVLEWQPRWTVRMGLEEMVRYYKAKMEEGSI